MEGRIAAGRGGGGGPAAVVRRGRRGEYAGELLELVLLRVHVGGVGMLELGGGGGGGHYLVVDVLLVSVILVLVVVVGGGGGQVLLLWLLLLLLLLLLLMLEVLMLLEVLLEVVLGRGRAPHGARGRLRRRRLPIDRDRGPASRACRAAAGVCRRPLAVS